MGGNTGDNTIGGNIPFQESRAVQQENNQLKSSGSLLAHGSSHGVSSQEMAPPSLTPHPWAP